MNNLAIFDLDYTLILGDSDVEWPRFLMDKGLLDRAFYDKRNDYFYEQYKNGTMDIDEFLAFQLEPLSRFDRQQLDQLHEEFLQNYIIPIIPQGARDLVKAHQQNQDEVLVITATNRFITAPIVAQFEIDQLIAVELEEQNGRYTGNYVGVPSFKEGKITRLNHWLSERNLDLDDFDKVYFYSDSRNDMPLLSLVNSPVAVNPDDFLRQHANKHNWQIIDFQL
ncbi:HAD family hydrolase [Neisseria sp. Ec49-e6-T10]|uniref:histidinol-phosphatase n=1 Tax=Neisseria sp. Ec49-e6-T10 TaxID=3140744 RepID=UPI003EBACACD